MNPWTRIQRVVLAVLLSFATPVVALAAPCGTDATTPAAGASLAAQARAAMAIVIAPSTLPDGTLDQPYEEALSATGGFEPYVFQCLSGELPDGLALESDGRLHGIPAAAGTWSFVVGANDVQGQFGSQAYTIRIDPPVIVVAPATAPGGTVGVPYELLFDASGGTAPYTYATTAGALPPGLFLSSDGTLNGTPNTPGTHGFTVTATDNYERTGERAYAITVASATITITPGALPDALVGAAYEQPLAASGGTGPYSFSVASGTLPPGMSLDGDGIIDGTPEAPGSYAFVAAATDAFGQSGEQAYTLVVAAPVIVLSPATLADATLGVDYHATFSASGGNAPYTFEVTDGALPPGLFLASDGALTGAPTAAGAHDFTVTATDNYDQTGSQAYRLVVAGATITLVPTSLPDGEVDLPYQQAISATGGTAPYLFALGGGTLPPGLVLATDGTLAGTPTQPGAYAFTVVAMDAQERTGEQAYTVAIAATALPDPTEDPDVVGLLTSQVSTVRTFATTQIDNVHRRLETLHDGSGEGWGFWIAGSVRQGDRDGDAGNSPASFETSGVTGGTDYRPGGAIAFGAALGFARDRTAVGDRGSRNDGDAPSGVSYMSWHPEDLPFFLDGMGGHQTLHFDVQRVSADGATFLGRRTGKQRFTSWAGGYEHRRDAFLFSPYARVDAANARLHGFAEEGDDPLALHYGSQAVDLRTTTLGFRMHYRMDTEWGAVEPRLRVEFQRDFHEDRGVAIRYANQADSPVFLTSPVALDRDRIVLELGTVLRTHWYGLLLRVDYVGVYGGYNDDEHALRFSFQED